VRERIGGGKIEARQARVDQAEAEHRKATGRQGGKTSRAVKPAGEEREPAPRGYRLVIAQLFYSVKRQPPDMGFFR
jgi:hypothetical protein